MYYDSTQENTMWRWGIHRHKSVLSVESLVKWVGWFHSSTLLLRALRLKTSKPKKKKKKIIIGTVFEWKKHKCSDDHIRLHILQYITLHLLTHRKMFLILTYYTIQISIARSFVRSFHSIGFSSAVYLYHDLSCVRCVCVYHIKCIIVLSCLVLCCVWVSYH